MRRIFHLSFLLDRDGYKRIDLVSFYELSKLDEFIIDKFKGTRDVRQKYEEAISEFCLDNMDFIKRENEKNKRNWLGSVAIIADERDNNDKTQMIYKIPIIYQKDKKLLSKENCLTKIKEKLKDKRIVKKIFDEKKFLLSDYEKDLLMKDYSRGDSKYLKSFTGNFYNRLKRSESDELLYFYCRSLINICELNELSIQTDFGEISHISLKFPEESRIERKNNLGDDAYLNLLIDNSDYDELFKIYDIDEINRNSDLFERGKGK